MLTLMEVVHNKETGRKKVNVFVWGCTDGTQHSRIRFL